MRVTSCWMSRLLSKRYDRNSPPGRANPRNNVAPHPDRVSAPPPQKSRLNFQISNDEIVVFELFPEVLVYIVLVPRLSFCFLVDLVRLLEQIISGSNHRVNLSRYVHVD